MELHAHAFAQGERIPERHACDGADVSPALAWSDAPAGTRSFALIVDDPDARGFAHWLIYDLPCDATALGEGVPPDPELSNGARQGVNDFGRLGYGGPCPPRLHEYYFKLYALDAALGLAPGATREEVFAAMRGHVLATAVLMARYERP